MPAASIDELWLQTLNRVCDLAAHEIKGALNGVSVNLEVVRSRAAGEAGGPGGAPGAPVSTVSRFADASSTQLGHLIGMTEAVVALARRPRSPFELAPLLRRFAVLLGPAAATEGRALVLVEPLDDLGTTDVSGTVVRLALGAGLLDAMECASRVEYHAKAHRGTVSVCIDGGGSTLRRVDQAIVEAAAGAGMQISGEGSRITLVIPRQVERTTGSL